MSQYDTIRYETDDGLLRLTLNRPDHMNAFTVAMADELEDAYRRANGDDAVKAIVVTGEGKAFSAGGDIPEFSRSVAEGVDVAMRDFVARGQRRHNDSGIHGECLHGARHHD